MNDMDTYSTEGSSHDSTAVQSAERAVYRSYTREHLLSVAKEAADNAAQFLHDADILGRTRSFRHACGLIALAEEEMAKALVLAFCATGILAHRGWFQLAFQKHKDKHVAMSVVAIVSRLERLYRGAIPTRRPATQKSKMDSFTKLLNRTVELLHRPKYLTRQFAGLLEELRTLAELQKIRDKAFYVDLKPAPSRDICAKEFRRLLRMARGHQACVKWGEFVGSQARASLDKLQGAITEKTLRDSREAEAMLFDRGYLARAVAFLESSSSSELLEKVKNIRLSIKEPTYAKALKNVDSLLRELATQLRKSKDPARSPSEVVRSQQTVPDAPTHALGGSGRR